MKIMLDAYNMGLQRGTGVATYGRHLSSTIRQLGHRIDILYGGKSTHSRHGLLSEVTFFDAAKPKTKGWLRQSQRIGASITAHLGCRVDRVPISGGVVRDALRSRMPQFDEIWNSEDFYQRAILGHRLTNRFARINKPDVDIAHWTYPVPACHDSALNIYTMHDLVPLRLPHTTLDNKAKYFHMCSQIVRDAAHIVTVSENSRTDIINLLGADPDKVTNTWQSVEFPADLIDKPDADVATELKGTFGLEFKDYFLFYGALEPKKNIGRIIEAYLASGSESQLVIVGAPGWGVEDELRLLKSLTGAGRAHIGARIIQLEYLPLSVLVSMIRGAKATLFPSLYEGFGLPVIESMLLGTAVVTSNTSCLPEIAGDAALLTDPYDTGSIVEAIRALDQDDELRRRLEDLGQRRARTFSAASHAARIGAVYDRVHTASH